MKKLIVLALLIGTLVPFLTLAGEGENLVSVSGVITDKVSGEALPGVKVKVEGMNMDVYTDFEGNFIINGVKPGEYNLSLSLVSYEDQNLKNIKVAANQNEVRVEMKGK